MLERIDTIQGIGLLHNAVSGRHGNCKKATLIYADNGRGKSTLAAVLRSLSNGNPAHIVERHTIDGTLPASVSVRFRNGHLVSYAAGAWSEERPEVVVFDADFVERNVHSGGMVNTTHRKNLLEFALGEAAVAARRDVEGTTAAARVASESHQGVVRELTGYHAGMTLPQFSALELPADADAQILDLQKRIAEASGIATIVAKQVPSPIALPFFDIDSIFQTLRSALESVHANAERTVREHIEKFEARGVEGWLNHGRALSEGHHSCPFCGQDTTSNDLIKAYQSHFNEEYNALKRRVVALRDQVFAGTSSRRVEMFSEAVATAQARTEGWAEHEKTAPVTFDVAKAAKALEDLAALLNRLTGRKEGAPAERLGSDEEYQEATDLWSSVQQCMQATNAQITSAATSIEAFKGKLATENVATLQSSVARLQAAKQRHSQAVVDLLARHDDAKRESVRTEAEKKASRERFDSLMQGTLERYERTINNLLTRFGASFHITDMGGNFRGKGPRSEYGLALRGLPVALEGGAPSFSTTLSEGDKRTLAFAFFVASTMADPHLASKVVVIDDPMCSLDLNRRHHTRTVLKTLHDQAEQLIVLAHDPYFLRDLRDELKVAPASLALTQLVYAANDYSTFGAFDPDKECESEFARHHRLLSEFDASGTGDAKPVAAAIRLMLEAHLFRRFPNQLPKGMMFGQLITHIRDTPPPSRLTWPTTSSPSCAPSTTMRGCFTTTRTRTDIRRFG